MDVSCSVVATLVPEQIYQRTKFQFPSSSNFGDMEGSQNKVGLLIAPDAT